MQKSGDVLYVSPIYIPDVNNILSPGDLYEIMLSSVNFEVIIMYFDITCQLYLKSNLTNPIYSSSTSERWLKLATSTTTRSQS